MSSQFFEFANGNDFILLIVITFCLTIILSTFQAKAIALLKPFVDVFYTFSFHELVCVMNWHMNGHFPLLYLTFSCIIFYIPFSYKRTLQASSLIKIFKIILPSFSAHDTFKVRVTDFEFKLKPINSIRWVLCSLSLNRKNTRCNFYSFRVF